MATRDLAERGPRLIRAFLPDLIVAGVAGGFALLLAEMLLTEHTGGVQAVAVWATVAGLVLCLAGLVIRSRRVALLVGLALVLLSLTGPVGLYLHATGEAEARETRAPAKDRDPRDEESEEGEEGEGGEEGKGPPPLSPLSLSGLALMGAVAVAGREEGDR
jgi:multisubunit Na+/H+ antiporter MnhG subunit